MLIKIILLLCIAFSCCSEAEKGDVSLAFSTNCTYELSPVELFGFEDSRWEKDSLKTGASSADHEPHVANCSLKVQIETDYGNREFLLQQSALVPTSELQIITYDESGTKQLQRGYENFTYYQGIAPSHADDYVVLKVKRSQQSKFAWIEGLVGLNSTVLELRKAEVPENSRNITLKANRIHVESKDLKLKSFATGRSTSEMHQRFIRSVQAAGDQKSIELHLIHDFGMFIALGRNIQNNVERSVDIVNMLDTVYRTLNTRVALISVEVWNIKDQILISSDDQQVLTDLMTYAEPLLRMPNIDNVQLLSNTPFANGTVGLAYVSGMCTPKHSGGIVYDNTQSHYINAARTLVHELGHNLGMTHDDNVDCRCPTGYKTCFMASREYYPISRFFSDCSVNAYNEFLGSGYGSCLLDEPDRSMRKASVCGNNLVESGEECDCGHPYFCTSTCCDASTCKFNVNAECDTGPCCHQCHLKPQFSPCRQQSDECDISEYCTGTSAQCPVDDHHRNGVPCRVTSSHPGLCLRGRCMSRDRQCQRLWGSLASDSGSRCYETLNQQGTAYGHCGTKSNSSGEYQACPVADTFCGLLQCLNPTNTMPVIGTDKSRNVVFVQVGSSNWTKCYSGSVTLGDTTPDPGMVADGTPCAENKYCFNMTCVNQPVWQPCSANCSEHGQCTETQRCACDVGWEGPLCSVKSTTYLQYRNTSSGAAPPSLYPHAIAAMIFLHNFVFQLTK